MFVRAVKNNKGKKDTYFCSLVESYRDESGVPRHRVLINLGKLIRMPFLIWRLLLLKRSLVLFMMMNSVVKSSELSQLFCDFNSIIQSDIVTCFVVNKKDFTRNRNMNFYSVIYYFIFRNKTTTNAELTHFYSSIE